MKRTKFDKLMAFNNRFFDLMSNIPDEVVQRFCNHWQDCASKIHAWLNDPSTGIKKSAVAEGLEQGLREMPRWFRNVSPEWREQARQAMTQAVTEEYPDFFSKDRKHLSMVLARGKIQDEAEYYMVRHEIDLNEGDVGRIDELAALYKLVSDFECS